MERDFVRRLAARAVCESVSQRATAFAVVGATIRTYTEPILEGCRIALKKRQEGVFLRCGCLGGLPIECIDGGNELRACSEL